MRARPQVASELCDALNAAPDDAHPRGAAALAAAPDDALLCATALLASQPLLAGAEEAQGSASAGSLSGDELAEPATPALEALRGEGLRLLRALCAAPLRRLTPDSAQLATFAWTWVRLARGLCASHGARRGCMRSEFNRRMGPLGRRPPRMGLLHAGRPAS